MENARQLDERLRMIIREVSSRTGNEIKLQVEEELVRSMECVTSRNSRHQTLNILSMLKKSIDGLDRAKPGLALQSDWRDTNGKNTGK
ncbi:MAG: hypothetical protein ACOY31_07165 [Bacillota bacterium]